MSDTMKALGFFHPRHGGNEWINETCGITVHKANSGTKPWWASRGGGDSLETLHTMANRGNTRHRRTRYFATPEAAAKAAIEAWR